MSERDGDMTMAPMLCSHSAIERLNEGMRKAREVWKATAAVVARLDELR